MRVRGVGKTTRVRLLIKPAPLAGSNTYKTLCKAITGIKSYEVPLATVEDAISVPGIGPYTVQKLKEKLGQDRPKGQENRKRNTPDPSSSVPPNKRGDLSKPFSVSTPISTSDNSSRAPSQAMNDQFPITTLGVHPSISQAAMSFGDTTFVNTKAAPPRVANATTEPSLSELLAMEGGTKRRASGSSLDPSRQASRSGTWITKGAMSIRTNHSARASTFTGASTRTPQTMASMAPPPLPLKGSLQRTASAPAHSPAVQGNGHTLITVEPPPIIEINRANPCASTNLTGFPSFEPIIIEKGTYEIILVLDNREVRTASDRSGIAEALRREDIRVEIKALNLGDVCWIAQSNVSGEYCRISLDAILERKRLDDLVGSIKVRALLYY